MGEGESIPYRVTKLLMIGKLYLISLIKNKKEKKVFLW